MHNVLCATGVCRGILGVHIHQIKDRDENIDSKGTDLFNWEMPYGEKKYKIPTFPTYDWVNDNGRSNLPTWVEIAAQKAGR